jgi:hypothetical protein
MTLSARLAALLLAASPWAALAQSPSSPAVDTLALRARAAFLSHDLLAGRAPGTSGQELAALYLETELRRLGARGGAPDGSYQQRVPLARVHVDSARTRIVVRHGARADSLSYGEFIVRGGRRELYRDLVGVPVFLGRAAALVANPAAVPPLAGRIAVILPGGDLDAAFTLLEERRAEAVAVVLFDAARYDRAATNSRLIWQMIGDAQVAGPAALRIPFLIAGPRAAAALGISASDTMPPATQRSPRSRSRTLADSMRLDIEVTLAEIHPTNVVGRIESSDSSAADETIVLQAHYDHLGIGPAVAGDSIYNGFMDDAGGVAAVLSAAEALADSARRGRLTRSVTILLVTAEESGSLGSAYYVAHPGVPLSRTRATITLDLPAPLAPPVRWILEGNDSTLVRLARDAVRPRGWQITGAPALPNSDHLSWIARGVPSVFVVADSGWEGVSPEQEEALITEWWHPHQPSDEWHEDFPSLGLARQAELLIALTMAYAERP